MIVQIDQERLLESFLTLASVDSESLHEGALHQLLAADLKILGCQVQIDKSGKKMGSDAPGNIIATLKGTRPGKPFLLLAHMDTVRPGKNVKPQVRAGRVVSDGTTILGADDKAGLAIILEVLRVLKESKAPHGPVQAVFTLAEEKGMYGAKYLDYSKLKGREGLVLDSDNVDELTIQGPQKYSFNVTIKGVASHAGVAPEKGISALEVAAYALSRMKLGRIDKDTVCNFGVVTGDGVTNVVLPQLTLQGEVRSLYAPKLQKQMQHMKDCFAKAIKAYTKKVDGKTIKPEILIETPHGYDALNVPKNARVVELTRAAAKRQGIALKLVPTGGGCDANVMSGKGYCLPNLGIGAKNCHTTAEYLELKDFYAAANIVLDAVLNYN